jgi:excisionase family DNA binding protein
MSDLATALLDALDEDALDRLARRLAPHLPDGQDSGFLDVAGAAAFLACPTSRVYALTSAGRLPVHRDGTRLLFDRGELASWVRNGGAKRP